MAAHEKPVHIAERREVEPGLDAAAAAKLRDCLHKPGRQVRRARDDVAIDSRF